MFSMSFLVYVFLNSLVENYFTPRGWCWGCWSFSAVFGVCALLRFWWFFTVLMMISCWFIWASPWRCSGFFTLFFSCIRVITVVVWRRWWWCLAFIFVNIWGSPRSTIYCMKKKNPFSLKRKQKTTLVVKNDFLRYTLSIFIETWKIGKLTS